MEGDAGSGRLSLSDSDDTPATEVTAEDSSESEVGTDQTDTEVTAEDSSESEVGTDQVDGVGMRGPSRLGRGWLIGTAMVLVGLAGAAVTGGYFAVRAHQDSEAAARADTAAVAAAKDCIGALNAPDAAAMQAAQRKVIDCATGSFAARAPLIASVLADAYAEVDSHVRVLDMRAAVERHNDDRSIDVLAALRAYVSSTDQEASYRLRVTMEPVDGQYKVAQIDQVAR